MNKFPYKWTLKDATFTKDKGKVFSCFSCGGGSTMGFKLAGFDVIGCNEIDPRMMKVYQTNHNPKYAYLEPIQEFKNRTDIPEELFNLDILDGSPPCSTFSMAGVDGGREQSWGKEKRFREGQKKQVLDTLFFDFIDLAKKLRPKIVIAENVKGLMLGEARKYMQRIYDDFDNAGYFCQHWLLNSATMGVPQKRERAFFVCLRKDMIDRVRQKRDLFEISPHLSLSFNERQIPFAEIKSEGMDRPLSEQKTKLWRLRENGDIDLSKCCARNGENPNKFFNSKFVYSHNVCNTVCAKAELVLFDEPRKLNNSEIISASSFPVDYNFCEEEVCYICGMSVPPVMMAQIASAVYEQWLSKIE